MADGQEASEPAEKPSLQELTEAANQEAREARDWLQGATMALHTGIEQVGMQCGVLLNILLLKGIITEEEVEVAQRIWIRDRNKAIEQKIAATQAKKAAESEAACASGSN